MRLRQEEYQLKTRDGRILFMCSWQDSREPRGMVGLVHGFADHGGRYRELVRQLTNERLMVFGFDHRGHGRSEGLRAYIPSYKYLLDDLNRFVDKVRHLGGDKPLFLLGQSIGGCLLAHYAWSHPGPVAGVILCSPAIKVIRRHRLLINLLGPPASLLMPMLVIPRFIHGFTAKRLSRDPKAVSDFERDPFVYHGPMRNRTGWELVRLMRSTVKNAERIELPLLVLHGEADRLADPEGSKLLFQKASSRDKHLHIYPSGYHELLKDVDRERVFEDILAWLRARL